MASSVLLHGILLALSAQLAGLFSAQTKSPEDLIPVEMVELQSEPVLENLTNEVDAPPPATPAQVEPVVPSSPVELAAPEALPPVPSQNVAPVTLPSPAPSPAPTLPTPTPTPVPASPTPVPSPVSAAPSPTLTPTQPVVESPPTANVQPLEQPVPTVLPETGGAETTSEEPSTTAPNLAPVGIDPEAIPAQVRMTVAIAASSVSDVSPSPPAAQQWVFEPNPITSSCPAMTPGVVRQFGTLVTLEVVLEADDQILRMTPISPSEDTADSIDYLNFVQCVVAERWQTEPALLPASLLEGRLLVIDVIAEGNDSIQSGD